MNRFAMTFVSMLVGYGVSLGAYGAACTAGQRITTFGPPAADGYVQVSPWLTPGTISLEGLIVDSDGNSYTMSIVAADSAASFNYAGVVRTSSGGAIDHTYGGFSFVAPGGQASPAQNVQGSQITQDRNGKVIVAVFNNTGIAVTRFLTSGMPDASFGVNGLFQVTLSDAWGIMGLTTSAAPGADEEADGNILIATAAHNPSAPNRQQPVLIKLTPAGALDTSFGVGGLAYFYPTGYADTSLGRATDLMLLENGEIVVTGRFRVPNSSPAGSNFEIFVARLSTMGALDTTFGNNGFTIRNFGPDLSAVGRKLAIQPDGKIISVGSISPSDGSAANNAAVAFRFNADGSVDSSFGTAGVSQLLSGFFTFAGQVALQDNEKILVSFFGFSDAAETIVHSGFARLTGSGQLDRVFGYNGIATLTPAGPTAHSLPLGVNSFAVAGRRIIVSASASNGTTASAPQALFLAAIDTGEGPNCH